MTTPEDLSHQCTTYRSVAAAMFADALRCRKQAVVMSARAGEMMRKALAARVQAAIDRAA